MIDHNCVSVIANRSDQISSAFVSEHVVDTVYLADLGQECIDTVRIELFVFFPNQVIKCALLCPGQFVRPSGYQGVEYVGYCYDACGKRYLFSLQAMRITGAIESFMM